MCVKKYNGLMNTINPLAEIKQFINVKITDTLSNFYNKDTLLIKTSVEYIFRIYFFISVKW